jgi:hypothetical protein
MINTFKKQVSDSDFNTYKGKYFDENWYTTIIEHDYNGYYIDSSGIKKVLFIFKQNIIPKEISDIAIDSFLKESKKKHSNRGLAGGIIPGNKTARTITKTGQNEGNYTSSNISGYFDRPLREHRGLFDSQIVCRTTSFTLNNQELWNTGIKFIQYCSKLYSRLAKKYYSVQKEEYSLINKSLRIPDTVFTTVTSNYNWRTACHCDSGDFQGGLGNLTVLGKNFTGCYLGFPQFKVLIKIKPNDFLLMDVHQWHCNTKLNAKKDGFRLSFVMYIRNDMYKCNKKVILDKTKYYH